MTTAGASNLAAAPLLVPLAAGILSLVLRERRLATGLVGAASAAAQVAVAAALLARTWSGGVVTLEVGDWPAPFGIVLAVDLPSAVMVGLVAVVGSLGFVHAAGHVEPRRHAAGFFGVYHLLLAGLAGAFVTGDLFNLFVWFEVFLVASYVLLALGSTPYQLREGLVYQVLNMVASAVFLVGVALVYRVAGTLNMADLAVKARALEDGAPLAAASLPLLFAFGLKAGLFPLFFWLPRPYDASPSTVTPVFAALLTNAGVYALLRTFGMLFGDALAVVAPLLLALAVATALAGAAGALAERSPKRSLGFVLLSQIGLVAMGLGLGTPEGLSASFFLVLHDAVTFPALFLAVAFLDRLAQRRPDGVVRGLVHHHPAMAALFFGAVISMAGAPPWSGFFAKLALLVAAFQAGQAWLAATAVVTSLLVLVALARLFVQASWGDEPGERDGPSPAPSLVWPFAALVGLSLAMGVGAGSVTAVTSAAAAALVDPSAYVDAVLGTGR